MLTSLTSQRDAFYLDISTSWNFRWKRISVVGGHVSENHHRWMRIVSDTLQLQVFVNVRIATIRSFPRGNFSLERILREKFCVATRMHRWECYRIYEVSTMWPDAILLKILLLIPLSFFPDFRAGSLSCITMKLEKPQSVEDRLQ